MPDPQHAANRIESVTCAVLTISDTRTPETDAGGTWIRERLASAGHRVSHYEILPDSAAAVSAKVRSLCEKGDCDAVLLTGGTGLAPRDTTYEAVSSLLDKRLSGFGELFRMLSFAEVGAAAMLSRAIAGVHGSTAVFSMPGSLEAVRLAMDRLILPQLGHVIALLRSK